MNIWKETTLGEVLGEKGYIRGPFGSSLRRNELLTEGIPVYEQQNAIYDNREFRYFIDEDKYQSLSRFTVKEHDLIISCSGTIGKISIIKKDDPFGIISQALLILRPDTTQVLPKYLYYFFNSAEGFNSLVSRSSGSVQVNIAERKIIQGIDLFLPPLPEQKAIAAVLSSFDDKIDLLRRQNRTLEALAQAVFKEWFVHFRVNHEKLRMNTKTGLPEGWRMGTLEEVIDILGGGTPKTDKANYWNGDIPWFSVVDVPGEGNVFVIGCEKHITEEGLNNSSTRILPVNTTIITARGTVGKLALTGVPMAMNQSCYGIIPKDGESFYYLYLLIKNSLAVLKSQVHGAVFDTITRDTLNNIEIVISPDKILKSFDSSMKPLFQKILNNNYQIQTLSKLRDVLLPKLMKGEVKVGG